MILTGRKQLFTNIKPDASDKVLEIISDAYTDHLTNRAEMEYLYNMYRGKQDVYGRVKTVREDICNKIVENHAYEFTEFKKGYTFGEPVQYIQYSKTYSDGTPSEENQSIAALNELMRLENKTGKDVELAEWFYICGTAYRMVLPRQARDIDESPFVIGTLDPRDAFVVYSYDIDKRPVLGVKYIKLKEKIIMGAYSNTTYWEIEGNSAGTFKIIKSMPNPLGLIPIIEYPANPSRLGCFEPVVDILNAMNEVVSNRVDGVEQFVQALMKFINCDVDEEEFERIKQLGAIKIKSNDGLPADVQLMTAELDQQQTQTLVDYMYQTALIIAGVPDRKASAGGNTGQALIIGQGWSNAEARAQTMEQTFKPAERQFLKVVLRILRDTSNIAPELNGLNLSDIDIKFTRNRTDSLLVKTQGLLNQLQAGVHPRISLSTCGLYSDPEQVYNESQAFMEKWKTLRQTQANNNPLPEDGGFN